MKVRPTYSNNRQGFTLVEVIVVIVILGILAMLAVPRLSGFSEMAEKENDQMTAEIALNAMQFYCVDYNIENAYTDLTYDSDDWKDILDSRGLWPAQDQSLESTYYTGITLSVSVAGICTVTLEGDVPYVIPN